MNWIMDHWLFLIAAIGAVYGPSWEMRAIWFGMIVFMIAAPSAAWYEVLPISLIFGAVWFGIARYIAARKSMTKA